MAFVLTGPWQSQYGSWGHIFDDEDPAPWTDRPKFQVLLDQIAQCVETPPTGIKTPNKASAIALTVFPNPSNGVFHWLVPEPWQGQKLQIQVLDGLGRIQWAQEVSENTVTFGAQLSNGVYWMKVLSEDGVVLGKTGLVVGR